mgnify:CR=1 FL=1
MLLARPRCLAGLQLRDDGTSSSDCAARRRGNGLLRHMGPILDDSRGENPDGCLGVGCSDRC